MSPWFGVVATLAGLWLIYDALARRRRVRAAAADAIARGEPIAPGNKRLSALADIMPPLVHGALVIAAVQLVVAWLYTPVGGWFGAFDLGALLFLLAAYGFWLSLKTRYRPGWRPA